MAKNDYKWYLFACIDLYRATQDQTELTVFPARPDPPEYLTWLVLFKHDFYVFQKVHEIMKLL